MAKIWPQINEYGGPGSGDAGHAGRPGQRGGSLPSGASGIDSPQELISPEGAKLMKGPIPKTIDEAYKAGYILQSTKPIRQGADHYPVSVQLEPIEGAKPVDGKYPFQVMDVDGNEILGKVTLDGKSLKLWERFWKPGRK